MYTVTDLGTLGGTSSTAYGINNSGQVVGYATTGGDAAAHAFLYSGGSMQDLGTALDGTYSDAIGINNSGQVVGDSDGSAFLYTGNGPIQDLNTLVSPTSGWTLEYAYGVNDMGQIVGQGQIGGHTHAFLLTPIVPEPSTLVLLAAGAVGLLGFAWRRRAKT